MCNRFNLVINGEIFAVISKVKPRAEDSKEKWTFQFVNAVPSKKGKPKQTHTSSRECIEACLALGEKHQFFKGADLKSEDIDLVPNNTKVPMGKKKPHSSISAIVLGALLAKVHIKDKTEEPMKADPVKPAIAYKGQKK